MKNIIIIFIFLPFSFFSQEDKNTFSLLFVGGVSPSQVHGDNFAGFHKVGAIAGIGIESDFNKHVKGSLIFQFIQKGARKNQNLEKNDLTAYYLNLNYLEVPLLLTYTHKKYLFDVGLSAAYLINYYEADQNMNFTGMLPFRKYDISVKVGLGYNISPKWFVNLRSSNSFITTRPNVNNQVIYFNNIIARTFNKGYYNNIIEFTIGYRLKPKTKNAS